MEVLESMREIKNSAIKKKLYYSEVVTSILRLSNFIKTNQHVSKNGNDKIIVHTNGRWKIGDLELNYSLKSICDKFAESNNLEEFMFEIKSSLFRRNY